MVQKRSRWTPSTIEQRLPDARSPDEVVRGDVARGLCPCHVGWEVFERHVSLVFQLLKDPSHVVRAQALHVFEDAGRMTLAEDMRYQEEAGSEKIGEKRAFLRSIEERLEARRTSKIRKLRGRRRRR